MLSRIVLALCFFVTMSGLASAEEADKTSGPYIEIAFSQAVSKDKTEQPSSLRKHIYVEQAVAGDWSLWALGFKSPEFEAVYAGVAKKVGDWSIALGSGSAEYGGNRHTLVNPWVLYTGESVEVFLSSEYYLKDKVDPWYHEGHIHMKFSSSCFAGVYGEKYVGLGPMIGCTPYEKIKIWVTAPVAYQPDSDYRTKMVIGATVAF